MPQEAQIFDQRIAMIHDCEDAEQAVEETNKDRGAQSAAEEPRGPRTSFPQSRNDQGDRKNEGVKKERLKRSQGCPHPDVVNEQKFAREMKEGIAQAGRRENRERQP